MGRRFTYIEFVSRAKAIHKNKYDYNLVYYVNKRTKVCIICKLHGEFYQRPGDHIHNRQGCPNCSKTCYSKISIQYLNELAKELKVDIQHAENKGEYIIDDPELKCYYKADGYYQDNKKYAIEFHGDYFHGNPKVYDPNAVCKLRRMKFDELYKKNHGLNV